MASDLEANDLDDTWLWAYVRVVNDERRLTVSRSTNDGKTWSPVSAPAVETYARPGLAHARVLSGPSAQAWAVSAEAWVLAWSDYNAQSPKDSGRIMVSVSTDDGSSWSPPEQISDFYRAQGGVSVACNEQGGCLLGFSWAGQTESGHGQNRVRYIHARVDLSARRLILPRTCYPQEHSRVAPAISHDFSNDNF